MIVRTNSTSSILGILVVTTFMLMDRGQSFSTLTNPTFTGTKVTTSTTLSAVVDSSSIFALTLAIGAVCATVTIKNDAVSSVNDLVPPADVEEEELSSTNMEVEDAQEVVEDAQEVVEEELLPSPETETKVKNENSMKNKTLLTRLKKQVASTKEGEQERKARLEEALAVKSSEESTDKKEVAEEELLPSPETETKVKNEKSMKNIVLLPSLKNKVASTKEGEQERKARLEEAIAVKSSEESTDKKEEVEEGTVTTKTKETKLIKKLVKKTFRPWKKWADL